MERIIVEVGLKGNRWALKFSEGEEEDRKERMKTKAKGYQSKPEILKTTFTHMKISEYQEKSWAMREKQINKTKHKQTKQLKKKVIETRKDKTKYKTKQNTNTKFFRCPTFWQSCPNQSPDLCWVAPQTYSRISTGCKVDLSHWMQGLIPESSVSRFLGVLQSFYFVLLCFSLPFAWYKAQSETA